MKLKELFCSHIFSLAHKELLYSRVRKIGIYGIGKYEHSALGWVCIKCGRAKTTTMTEEIPMTEAEKWGRVEGKVL